MIFQEHWSKLRLSFFFPNVIWLFRNVRLHEEKPKYKFLKIDTEMKNLIICFKAPPPLKNNYSNIYWKVASHPTRRTFSEKLKTYVLNYNYLDHFL